MQTSVKKLFGIALALVTWTTLALQFDIATLSITNFFSYFTVECNLLIAVSLTFSCVLPATAAGIFFNRLSVQSAIALYIFIVAVVYNTVLRGLVPLSGLGYFLDNMLHVVIPVLYIFYWLTCRTSGNLSWGNVGYWTIFPLLYILYSLVRGALVKWYPYPFFNVAENGYGKVGISIAVIIAVFLVTGFIMVGATKALQPKTRF